MFSHVRDTYQVVMKYRIVVDVFDDDRASLFGSVYHSQLRISLIFNSLSTSESLNGFLLVEWPHILEHRSVVNDSSRCS